MDGLPFAPASTPAHADQLDRAGQTILQLFNKAAGVAEENSRNAIELAQQLSHKLRAAEGRIAELEAQAGAYQEQAEVKLAISAARSPALKESSTSTLHKLDMPDAALMSLLEPLKPPNDHLAKAS